MRRIVYVILFCACAVICKAQHRHAEKPSFDIQRIDPPNWWIGMEDTTLQLCIHGHNISTATVSIKYPGVTIVGQSTVENPNYLFVNLTISPNTVPGIVTIELNSGKVTRSVKYALARKDTSANHVQGFDSRDLVYLIMPDRFSDGDTTNDKVKGMREMSVNRDSMFYRHGGDIKGVINHLDYLKDLGVTALWLTPIQENDEAHESYHGYAFTDHYKVDPRLGNLDTYKELVKEAHKRNLKMIMDMVYNHVGIDNWFMKDLPMHDWIHQTDTFFQTNFRATTLIDPHASEYDKNKMSNGWFVKSMPDLNQKNPYLAKYLIQNAIWWVESTGTDGFRIDTYLYSDVNFMSTLLAALRREYPHFSAVGELWEHEVAMQAYFMQHSKIKGAKESNIQGFTDFPLYFATMDALNKPTEWHGGLASIYYTLIQDVLYSDPTHNLIFLDNHDLSRFYSVIGEDLKKFKMGIGFLMTMRGIPEIYYGTEILMKNFSRPDGKVREDFPGGWPGDTVNKFSPAGRSATENEAFEFVKKLANYRKQNEVLQTGELTQFIPEKDKAIYVYFRSNKEKTVMVVMHYGDKPDTLVLSRFKEKLEGYSSGREIVSGKSMPLDKPWILDPYSINIVELKK